LWNLSVGEKAEKILVRLAQTFPKPGEFLDLSGGVHLEFKVIGRVSEDNELRFLMREFLSEEMGLHRAKTGLQAGRRSDSFNTARGHFDQPDYQGVRVVTPGVFLNFSAVQKLVQKRLDAI
jgi:hypothetical protein